MQDIVVAQAQSAVDGFRQFGVRCHTGRSFCRNLIIQYFIGRFTFCGFVGIRLAQGRKSSSHIFIGGFHTLVDGIDARHQIVIHLLDHFVLSRISPDPGSGFLGQSRIQVGHIFTDGVGFFHHSPILYSGIGLVYIVFVSLSTYSFTSVIRVSRAVTCLSRLTRLLPTVLFCLI